MRIASLKIKNFRSLHDVEWKPGPLNVLLGPNASGKSNLLRALELLGASAREDFSDYVARQGGMEALCWDGNSEPVCFEIEALIDSWIKQPPETLHDPRPEHVAVKYGFKLIRQRTTPIFTIRDEKYVVPTSGSDPTWKDLYSDYSVRSLHEMVENPIATDTTILSAYKALFEHDDRIRIKPLQERLATVTLYTALATSSASKIRKAVPVSNKSKLDATGENLASVLHALCETDSNYKSEIDQVLRAAFGTNYKRLAFPPSGQQIELAIHWSGLQKPKSMADLSDGTIQFIFLAAILLDPDPPSLIAIEDPEAGLHPHMLPIVAELAREASRKTQIVFATQSPDFLDAFRESRPTVTVFAMNDGKTVLNTIGDVELERWLQDFTLGDNFRTGVLEALG